MKPENSSPDVRVGVNRHRIEFYVPVPLPHAYHELRLNLEEHLSRVFGGATSLEGTGLWYDREDKQSHPDRVAVIYTDTDRTEQDVEKYISSLLAVLETALEEESEILVAYYPVKHARLTRKAICPGSPL